MQMPDSSDLRQILMACCMVLFIFSSMSMVWSFAQIVPWNTARDYARTNCSLIGIVGVPSQCYMDTNISAVIKRPSTQCTGSGSNNQTDTSCYLPQPPNCIQIFVKADSSDVERLLHEDEFDLAGMCTQRRNCSLFSGQCHNTTCAVAVGRIMAFLDESITTPLRPGQLMPCWVNQAKPLNMGVIGKRKFRTEGRTVPSVIVRAVLIPSIGLFLSMISCTAFWYRNQSSILQLTQSG